MITLTELASIATALAVGVAVWELHRNHKMALIAFEDSLDQQYRELANIIPYQILIGQDYDHALTQEVKDALYNYIDLTNEQIFLRANGRISKSRWQSWRLGIESNFKKTHINKMWQEVKASPDSGMTYLEQLEKKSFLVDPKEW